MQPYPVPPISDCYQGRTNATTKKVRGMEKYLFLRPVSPVTIDPVLSYPQIYQLSFVINFVQKLELTSIRNI